MRSTTRSVLFILGPQAHGRVPLVRKMAVSRWATRLGGARLGVGGTTMRKRFAHSMSSAPNVIADDDSVRSRVVLIDCQ